jgi:hypothetical protein
MTLSDVGSKFLEELGVGEGAAGSDAAIAAIAAIHSASG